MMCRALFLHLNFADIEYFKNLIGKNIPFKENLRQRLDEIAAFDSSSIDDDIIMG